ncbi:MAG: hypothetical protein JNM00_05245, partial [Flavobacteriales bacterium]|nr:hypothetical protein [Flavobacteriales bacterium]
MKNLSNIALPTVEEIQSYHAGMLPDARCREIELLALEHPLVADAIEGFGEIPAYTKVPVSMVKPVKPALWKT